MESSEEDDIINNDEDDYGEFLEKTQNSIKTTEENNIIILDKDNSNKNIQTEKDKIIIDEKKEIKEEKNDKNNIINEKIKKNNLIIVNKVIDLNINQNRNKKQTKALNSQQLKTKQYLEYSEESEKENEINDINFIEKNSTKKLKNKNQRKKIEQDLNRNITVEENFEKKNIKENKKNNLIEIKKNEDKSNEDNEDSEKYEQEEEEESWVKAENNLIIETKQTKRINSSESLNKQKGKKQIIIEEKYDSKNLINENKKNENEENTQKKENGNFENVYDSAKKTIEEVEKLVENINNNFIEIKINNSNNKEKEEKRIINNKKVYKNSNNKRNEYNPKTYSKDFNIEKSIDLEQLRENQNIFKETPTKLETNFESPSKMFQKNENMNNKEKEYTFSETQKVKNRNEEKNLNNNVSKNLSKSVNILMNIKSNSSSYFNNLLANKTFVKFLNHKLEQSKNKEDEIPKTFIENLQVKKKTENIIKENKQKKSDETISSVNYSLYYNEDNFEIPLYNKNYRRTVNSQYKSPKTNSINLNFMRRYENDLSIPIYDNLNDSNIKSGQQRFTTSGFNHFNDNISNLTLKNQRLHDKIIELQNEIRTSKNEMNMKNSELQKYSSTYNKMTLENNLNKEKIDELKKELKLQKGEMNEKQNKISELENINNTLKNEMTKLQKNYDEETLTNKEVRQNYDIIKANYNDIKNQYDLLNIKYQSLTDENFNFKRDKALYEKQIKTKNEMIESLIENKSNILNNKKYKYDSIDEKEKEESNHEMYLNYLKNKNLTKELLTQKEKEKLKEKEKENGLAKVIEHENREDKLNIDYSKFDNLTYPELQSKRDELINERKNINNIFNKIPIKSGYKSQIQKRKDLEQKLNEINRDLAIIKLRMKNLKK